MKLDLSKTEIIWLGQHRPVGNIQLLALDGLLLTLLCQESRGIVDSSLSFMNYQYLILLSYCGFIIVIHPESLGKSRIKI